MPCTSEGFDHFCFRSRIEIHVGDGASDKLTSIAKPLLSYCLPGPAIEAIKDEAIRTNAIENVGQQSVATSILESQ